MSDRPHPIGDPPADEPAPAPDPDEGWEEDEDDEEPLTRIGGRAGRTFSSWSFSAQLSGDNLTVRRPGRRKVRPLPGTHLVSGDDPFARALCGAMPRSKWAGWSAPLDEPLTCTVCAGKRWLLKNGASSRRNPPRRRASTSEHRGAPL